MVDFEKLPDGEAEDRSFEEPLTDEKLEDVAGGWSRPRVDLKGNCFCPAGRRIESGKGCRSCSHYHETATHYCSILEKKSKR